MSDLPTTSSPIPRNRLHPIIEGSDPELLVGAYGKQTVMVGEIDIIVRGVQTLLLGGYQVTYGVIEVLEDALLGVGPVGRFGLSRSNII